MIAKLRHRVLLCSQRDVIVDGTEMRLNREGVAKFWAAIEAKKASTFTPHGAAAKDSRAQRTHVITTRYRPDLNISMMAWLYEERCQSSPRWFKILAVNQTEMKGTEYFMFNCRLVERSDELTPPTDGGEGRKGPVAGLPPGVRL